jgi:hypothetical protein
MAMSDYAKHALKFWHWGKSADFVDLAQSDHWAATVRALERATTDEALEGDNPNTIIDFLVHQAGKPILPGLRRIIRRLVRGWPFPRDDGYLLRLKPPAFNYPTNRPPRDIGRPDRIRRAGMLAWRAIQQGVAKNKATDDARKACKVTIQEARAARDEWPNEAKVVEKAAVACGATVEETRAALDLLERISLERLRLRIGQE